MQAPFGAARQEWENDDASPAEAPVVPRFDVLLLGLGPDAHIALQILLGVTSLLLTLLILLHKGRGGGLSDMFGGGMSSNLGSSGVAERNLNRFTVVLGLVWGAVIIGLGLIMSYGNIGG